MLCLCDLQLVSSCVCPVACDLLCVSSHLCPVVGVLQKGLCLNVSAACDLEFVSCPMRLSPVVCVLSNALY